MAEKDKSTRKVSDYLEYDKDSRIFDSGVANGMMMLGMDIYQATQNVKAANEKQEDLKADTAERYGLLSDTDLDAFLAEEYKKELSKEYLVDGAILTCTNCTKEDVPIRLHNAVEIKSCVQIFEEIDASNFTEPADRVYGRLVVSENTDANVQGVKYATVGDSEKGYNIPFFGNCKRGPHCEEERKAFITQNNENNNEQQEKYPITRNVGSCKHLMKLEKEWENYPIEGSYFSFFDTKKEGSGAEKAGITMTSMLFCKHGGLIYPVTSGQNFVEVQGEIQGISMKALRALMELEVLNLYSEKYLVIENGKLIGIKPHLAGDGYITVAFGDCLQGDDLKFYLNSISGYLSDDINEYERMKDTVIPVEICFDKLIQDIEPLYQDALVQFQNEGIALSQNQLDAIVIAKYQCYKLGTKAYNAIKDGEARDVLYDAFLKAHGENGNFESRTTAEMNIYFDSNYEVEGGMVDITVEPLEAYDK
ncbi:MAG: hypothetical protein IJN54_06205 [Lachnospiraceae bacterium]|nr:hypothetical protein [Lachnospiraceae bacterium]